MLSVVIPAYNEEKSIQKTLEALTNQQTSKKFEVILVDNASTDKTAEVAKRFTDQLDLKIIREGKKGRGAARRTGFAYAKGDILFSSDADTIVPENWLEVLSENLSDSEAIAITGTCKIADCAPMTNMIFNFGMAKFMHFYRLLIGHYWLSGFSFAIKRDSYEKSGGFSEELTALEDIDLSFRVNKIGKIKMVAAAPVLFSGRRFKKGIIRGLYPYVSTFIGYYFLRKKNPFLSDIR